jgi:SAM-dependent methyltransferase
VCCDLCSKDDAALLVVKNGFHVVRCRGCTLVYVNPRPRVAALAAQYETDSFYGHQVERANDESWRPQAQARVALINRLHPARGALLDVGCSAGWFLSVARDAGWQVSGLDVSAPAVAYCRSRGFDARVATLDNHGLPPGRFDVITMFDCIEHMPSPMVALRAVRALLAPGGVVMITTPNVEGLFPRFTYQLFGRRFGAWDHPGPPGHIYQFGMGTMVTALQQTGFEVIHRKTEAIPLDFTVGALEDVIVDVMKGNARHSQPAMASTATAPAAAAIRQPSGDALARGLRRMARNAGRAVAWTLAGAVAAPAQLFGSGDSLIILARTRPS